MTDPLPLTRELVLIGGGHSHALVLRRWGMRPLPGARLTLINPGPTAPYTGMLPGYVAGHYTRDDLDIDLVRLARHAGARLILGAVDAIDRDRKRIHVPGRGEIAYDIASIDIGITSAMPDLPGFAAHGIAAKPLGRYAQRWADYLDHGRDAAIAVIGGGVAGVELAMAMTHALRMRGRVSAATVIDADRALAGVGDRARRALLARLDAEGIALIDRAPVAEIRAADILLRDGRTIASSFTVGAAGARPYGWLATTGLALNDGYLIVDDTLRSVTDPSIYAAGDCAYLAHAPRPKAGVFAVRAAPVLADNLRADLTGSSRRRFRPQRDYLKLISLGGRSALGEKFGRVVRGGWVWRWKDRIDRRFMARLNDLPPMPLPPLPRETAAGMRAELDGRKPLCGGCGAKIGGDVLRAALEAVPAGARDDIETRAGDDGAVLKTGGARQVITTDHLRALTNDPHLLARIAAQHAMGDIWAMGARPQAALANVILPRMTAPMQHAWLTEIMQAAGDSFADAGAEIVGGHSSLGAELTIGFTVTGLCDAAPVTLAGARPGDALILTRPIGAGVLLAAEMARQARGDDIAALFAEMIRSHAGPARLLRGAHAMTDVTGFGLAGHLMTMLDASDAGAEIDLAAVPVYRGAPALAARGIRSTLFGDNRAVAARMRLPDGPLADLLFDPQTAGGLLAAVPPEAADGLSAALVDAGARAARIGTITTGPPVISVR